MEFLNSKIKVTILTFAVITMSVFKTQANTDERTANPIVVRDSVVTFYFKPGKEMFFMEYKENEKELNRLAIFLQGNRAKIMRGHKKIYVDGYSNSLDTKEQNAKLAKVRSNHVKSYMVLMYGFKDEFFVTFNHADSLDLKNDLVEVSFTIPVYEKPKPKPKVERKPIEPIIVNANLIVDTLDPIRKDLEFLNKEMPINKLEFENPYTYALLKKGTYYASLYANFTNLDVSNMLIEPLFDVKNVYSKNFSIQGAFGYMVSNNVAIGAYGEYTFSDNRLEVESDLLKLLINSKNYQTNNASSGFSVGFFTKNFIPLEFRHRVFLINETSVFYNYKRSLSRNVYDNGALLSKVQQNTHMAGIKLSVGVQYFLSPGLTMDFSISPVAAFYQYNSVLNNETLAGKFAGGSFITMLMPIDLKFGLTYFFGLDYNENRKHIDKYLNSGILTTKKR